MNKGDGGRQPLLRNGWYKIGNTTFVQEMFYSEVNTATGAVTKIPKGIERIPRERNLWPDKGLLLVCPKPRCEPCQTLQRCKEVGLLAIFPRSLILINFSDCCARRLLSLQPDFMAQKCEIEERIEAHHRGFSFIQNFTVNLITLNIIGVILSKRYAREHCDYTIAGLRENVPAALSHVKNSTILANYNSCLKKMRLYQQGVAYGSGEWKKLTYLPGDDSVKYVKYVVLFRTQPKA